MNMLQDIRLAVRALWRAPAYTAAAVLTVAVGAAGVTTVFAVGHGLLLRPLPGVHAPGELVSLELRRQGGGTGGMASYPQYDRLRESTPGLAALAAWNQEEYAVVWPDGETEVATATEASASYFDVLGVGAAAGRLFRAGEEDEEGGSAVVVISHWLWQSRFGGEASVIGGALPVNGRPLTIIGVAAEGFRGTISVQPTDLWVPLTAVPLLRDVPGMYRPGSMNWLQLMGRLAPGTNVAQATSLLSQRVRLLATASAAEFDPRGGLRGERPPIDGVVMTTLRGLPHQVVLPAAGFLGLLLTAAALALIIGSVNLTGLMLARMAARSREMAVRRSLGASRFRLAAQLMIENAVLFVVGTGVGLLLTAWLLAAVPRLLSGLPDPATLDLGLTTPVLAFAVALAALLSLAFGLPPALYGAAGGTAPALGVRPSRRGTRLRSALVVAQVALCMVLLVSAGLLTRALQRGLTVETGFDAASVVVAELDLAPHGYDAATARILTDQLVERLSARPEIAHAGRSAMQPLLGYTTRTMRPDGQTEPPSSGIDANHVDLGFFRAVRVPFVAGRPFGPLDAGEDVAVVNQMFADTYWPGQDPLGMVIYMGPEGDERPFRIVGVTLNGRYRSLTEDPRPFVYLPWTGAASVNIFVRGDAGPAALVRAISDELRALDATIPLRNAAPLQRRVGILLLPQRIGATVLGAFGVIGLLLAAIGIYGLMAFSVAQRRNEIGIRMALGARAASVVRLFLAQGARLVAVGGAIGLLLGAVVAHALAALLYGVRPLDPVTFVAVPVALAAVALLAVYGPARQASRTDPGVVLRE